MTRVFRLISIAHSYAVALNRRLAHELARAGGDRWEVTAVAPEYFHGSRDLRPVRFAPIVDEPVKVEVVPARMTSMVHAFTYGRRLGNLLKGQWDLVHCWEEPYIAAGAQIAWQTPRRVPMVFWTAQNLAKKYPPPFSMFERYAVGRCAGWMACGQSTLQTMLDRPGYASKPHRIMPLGVDVDRFRPDPAARDDARRELAWDEAGPPVVGYLGRFTEEKGLHIAMKSLSMLSTPWRALFVGAGPMEAELRLWSQSFGDRVRIRNDVGHDQVPRFLNAMDMLLAPSQTRPRWREQFGRMLIEAFACGVPVLGSDSGEIPFVIGDAGMVLPEADPRAWADAMAQILESPDRRRELSKRGLDRVSEKYSWEKVAAHHMDFFTQIINGSAAIRRQD